MTRPAIAAALGLLFTAAPAAAQRHARLISRIDSLAAETLRRSPAPGLSIGVARRNETIVAKGYGLADPADRTPATERTIYQIASITKQFTAAAVLALAEQRKLKLTDPIGLYLPDYPNPPRDRITIGHLLSHTSGIQDSLPNTGPPGRGFVYSNRGYDLLGYIIERVSDVTYGTYLSDSLLRPLGLHDTYLCRAGTAEAAIGHHLVDDSLVPVPDPLPVPGFAAGGLCSNVVNLLAWARALVRRQVVNNRSWNEMTEGAKLKDGSQVSYGFGLTVGTLDRYPMVGHGGATPGFATQLGMFPDQELAVVVLANSSEGLTRRLADQIARLVLGVVEPEVKDLLVESDHAARYVGTYVLDGDSTEIEVHFRRDHVWAKLGDGDAIRLLHQGNDEFASESDPGIRFSFRVRRGRAQSVEFRPGTLSMMARRVGQ